MLEFICFTLALLIVVWLIASYEKADRRNLLIIEQLTNDIYYYEQIVESDRRFIRAMGDQLDKILLTEFETAP